MGAEQRTLLAPLAVGQVVGQAIRHAPGARPPHQLHLPLGETTATGGW